MMAIIGSTLGFVALVLALLAVQIGLLAAFVVVVIAFAVVISACVGIAYLVTSCRGIFSERQRVGRFG